MEGALFCTPLRGIKNKKNNSAKSAYPPQRGTVLSLGENYCYRKREVLVPVFHTILPILMSRHRFPLDAGLRSNL
jgi:hypothetical protein